MMDRTTSHRVTSPLTGKISPPPPSSRVIPSSNFQLLGPRSRSWSIAVKLNVQPPKLTDPSMGTLDEIPVEVMRRIFDFYMEGFSATSAAKLRTPATLCGVCTIWRDIAVNHPPLWSDVHIHAIRKTKTSPEDDNTFQLSRPLAIHLTARLARIGTFPMTLRIEFASVTIWGFGQKKLWFEGTPLGGFFKGHPLANLRLLHVDGQGGDVELYPQCLPRLEFLIMQHVNRLTVDNEDTVPLSPIPYLRRLVLKETQPSVLPPAFPWSQLSHLYLEAGFDLGNLYSTLRATSSLEELFIKFTSRNAPSFTQPQQPEGGHIASLDNLARIVLAEDNLDQHYRENLLTLFHWPALTHLRLSSGTFNWDANILRRCSSLTHLALSSNSPLIFDMESLDFFPSLVQLLFDVNAPIDHATLFRNLSFDARKPRLSNLEELGITCVIRPMICPWWYARNQSDAFSSLRHLISSRTLEQASATRPQTHLKRLALLISRGREYTPVAKEVEGIVRSFSDSLAEWQVVRGTGNTDCTFSGTFGAWESGPLRELAARLR